MKVCPHLGSQVNVCVSVCPVNMQPTHAVPPSAMGSAAEQPLNQSESRSAEWSALIGGGGAELTEHD